jgi:uncharacterized membrane protein
MTPFLFVLILLAVFVALVAIESSGSEAQVRLDPAGLLRWLVSGNWPAKVGAGLVIIGVGALLRYAFANIDVPPEMKLSGGALLAAALGFVSALLKRQPARRAIHLALAGAAFGVAYMTAYSAYGFFNFISGVNALALLALVAVATGVFAVSSGAMSVAVLAMVGAYLAPRFAIGQPDVLSVYGYYLAASVLTLLMVTARGWRPLIHLSFLFTLAGALFFGWSGRFYEPQYYALMQPLLLALSAVHLAMPLLERTYAQRDRLKHFDAAYFILLPLVAAALTLKIAPDLRSEGAFGLLALAIIWAVAAGVLFAQKRAEAARHGLVASLLALAAVFCYVQDMPWLLAGLGVSVAVLAVAPRMGWPRDVEELGCGAAILFGVLHIIYSIMQTATQPPFLNELFAQRLIAASLMMSGAWLAQRRKIAFHKMLELAGLGWFLLAVVAEVLRLNIEFLPQLVYGLLLGVMVLNIVFGGKVSAPPALGGLLIFAMICLGGWAARDASQMVAIVYLILTPVVLLGMAWTGRDAVRQEGSDFSPTMAIGLLPFALLPWVMTSGEFAGVNTVMFEVFFAMAGIAIAGLSARWWLAASPRWNETIQPLHVYSTALVLLFVTLLHIERGLWPVAFEVLALVYLIVYANRKSREPAGVAFGIGAMTVMSVALVIQAMLLRCCGPADAVMNAADINQMQLPAVASLMWVIFGAALAWWGTRSKSRAVWSAGAVLLVVAAVKLVLFDFGTLGQLGNILAFIAAGLVFLGVAWFAPPPAKAAAPEKHAAAPQAEIATETSAPLQPPPSFSRPLVSATDDLRHANGKILSTHARQLRQQPQTINGLWLLLLMAGLLVALLYTAWHKFDRINHRAANSAVQRTDVQIAGEAAASAVDAAVPDNEEKPPMQNVCEFVGATFPADMVVYAAGAYAGKETNFQIDQSGHQATRMDVTVNQPDKPVALILGAYEPTIWNVSWTADTRIVAVYISGYHRQAITGIDKSVPVLNSSYDNKGACGYLYMTEDNYGKINPLSRQLFGRGADTIYPAKNGKVAVGNDLLAATPLLTSSDLPAVEAFYDQNAPLAGTAGLEEAVSKGILRPATQQDAQDWADAEAARTPHKNLPPVAGQTGNRSKPPHVYRGYVVLKQFVYPAGLYGANAATFFIARGVPKPQGNPGHSAVYDFNRMLCDGALCGDS